MDRPTDSTKSEPGVLEPQSDEELERALRRELGELVCTSAAQDPAAVITTLLEGQVKTPLDGQGKTPRKT
ncbi:MAG: hypothetical protein AAF967_00480 [Pseudomonadota bacterium]